jgi:hypothetical protein
MESFTVVLSPSVTRTRVLVTGGPDELLRACLPPPSRVRRECAMPTFLEGLAMLLDRSVRVVLSVDAREAGFCLGLTDELGLGQRSLYYDVEVVSRHVRRRRGSRIRGVGDFADLRPLCLATDHGGAP